MLELHRNRVNECKRKTRLETYLLVAVSVLSVIAVLFAILYFSKESYIVTKEEVCVSDYCVDAAKGLLQFIDFTQDPCENFYEYVCGTYNKTEDENILTPTDSITNKRDQDLRAIVEGPIKETDSKLNLLIKKFYQECINKTKIELDENEAFRRAINDLGGWPLLEGTKWNASNFDWIKWYIKSKELGLPIYTFFVLTASETDGGDFVLKIDGPAGRNVNIDGGKYNTTMRKIIQILEGTSFSEDENLNVTKFARELKKLSIRTKTNEPVHTMKDLIGNCTFVPWMTLLRSLAGKEMFNNSSEIAFGDIKSYCVKLKELIDSTDARAIANYFVWSIIHQMNQFMSEDIRTAYASMRKVELPHNQVCMNHVAIRFPNVKETIFIRNRRPQIVKDQLNEMIDVMQNVFIGYIQNCKWMDDSMQVHAIKRIQSIDRMIGGDAEFDDEESFDELLGVDGFTFTTDNIFQMVLEKRVKEMQHLFRTVDSWKIRNWPRFIKNVMGMSAVFYQALNRLLIPAPILGSMFYDHRAPAFLNYGSIGSVIGHELMHGLEKSGRIVLENEEVIDWWTNVTAEAYDKAVQCVIDDYDNSPSKYVLNGNETLDENLSDFVGVDAAYEGYMKHVEQHGKEKKLPLNLTIQQVFWVQTGSYMCIRGAGRKTVYVEDVAHAAPKYRIEAAPRNSRYFAKDFHCSENSYMNPKNKCRVFRDVDEDATFSS